MIPSSGNLMKNYLISIVLLCLFVCANSALAVNRKAPEQWDRESAMAAVRSAQIDIAVNEIGNVATLVDGKATLGRLQALGARTDLPLPAREAAIYEFTRSLARLPRSAVAVEVIQHLQAYEAQTLVPHEDHGYTLVPLFNIRGAAAGVENGWQRSEFAIEAAGTLETNPVAVVSAYAETDNRNQRSGYLDALRQARPTDVETVQNAALERFERAPELSPLIAATAVITLDPFAIQQLLIHARGAGLSAALRQLDERLPTSETTAYLTYAIRRAPAENASLAIAAWWPRLRHEAEMRDLLVDKLDDPALGSAAALALAQSPDIQTIKLLQDTADGDSIAARRAQMALNMNRDRLIGEVRQ